MAIAVYWICIFQRSMWHHLTTVVVFWCFLERHPWASNWANSSWKVITPVVWSSAPPHLTSAEGGLFLLWRWRSVSRYEGHGMRAHPLFSESEQKNKQTCMKVNFIVWSSETLSHASCKCVDLKSHWYTDLGNAQPFPTPWLGPSLAQEASLAIELHRHPSAEVWRSERSAWQWTSSRWGPLSASQTAGWARSKWSPPHCPGCQPGHAGRHLGRKEHFYQSEENSLNILCSTFSSYYGLPRSHFIDISALFLQNSFENILKVNLFNSI